MSSGFLFLFKVRTLARAQTPQRSKAPGRQIIMPNTDVILRFNKVSFEYGKKLILNEADFSIRRGSKIALMGQNGAGKSTIFRLITGGLVPYSGAIAIENGLTMAASRQVVAREELKFTVREFFATVFPEKVYNLEPRIKKVLDVFHLKVSQSKILKDLSGGQQARLLLARALIQDPDILLLDEPTNNLDKAGIAHLTQFLIDYKKTCIVISHDAEFLNAFTHGVLYLDSFTYKIEQYAGNYLVVVGEIMARLERERMLNARLQKDIQHRKEQAGFFGQKGGHMRDVARKMKEKIEKLEGEIVEMRQEDKTIRKFAIPCQEDLSGHILELTSVSLVRSEKLMEKKVKIVLKQRDKLLLAGPNGIGKTTLLEKLAAGRGKGEHIAPGVRVSYYRQDFSTLDFDKTVYETLADACVGGTEEDLRGTAAGFLLNADILKMRVGSLSEGQKGLVAFAKICLERPGLLFLDEPTNHINFRHIPVIAQALEKYGGAMILVSHIPDFVKQIHITQVLDLETL
jgi:ATP-binding cassette subfamily F protein 3